MIWSFGGPGGEGEGRVYVVDLGHTWRGTGFTGNAAQEMLQLYKPQVSKWQSIDGICIQDPLSM